MRIIAGEYRSRTLEAPAGLATRPTSDRLRETLFNVLAPQIKSAAFLDLYAGSGAVGLEALSRGAAEVTFVEREPKALAVLRGNLARLGIGAGFRVQARSVAAFLKIKPAEAFNVVFLDPPYDASAEYARTLSLLGAESCFPAPQSGESCSPGSQNRDPGHPRAAVGLLAEGAVVIAEHRRKERLEPRYGSLGRTRLLEQGDAALSFYAAGTSGP